MTDRPDKEEAELIRDLASWFGSAGAGGAPPETLQLIRDHVQKRTDRALAAERERQQKGSA